MTSRLLLISLLLFLTGCSANLPATGSASSRSESKDNLREISGIVTGDQTLSGNYLVTADLMVAEGATLTIEAGTTLIIRISESTKVAPEYLSPLTEIIVRGRLIVNGAAEAPVRIFPEADSYGTDPLWSGITFLGDEQSSLSYLQIDRANNGIRVMNGTVVLDHADITGSRYGSVVQGSGNLKVDQSRIEKGEGGVYCYQGSLRLTDTVIQDNAEEGIFISPACEIQLSRVTSRNNAIGLVAPSKITLDSESRVDGNREADIRLLGADR